MAMNATMFNALTTPAPFDEFEQWGCAMSWGEEDIPGRLTKRQRNWQAKRSVRALGADGIPPIANPGGTAVMGQPASPEDWYAVALASHAVAEFLRWGVR